MASATPSGDPFTPAAQTTVPAATVSIASPRRNVTEPGRTSVTTQSVRTITPSRASEPMAAPESSAAKDGRMPFPPSRSSIRGLAAEILRNSRARIERASSPMAPAISTPVGPAPTTTNVNHSSRLGVVLELGCLERVQDPPAVGRRVLEGLQSRRVCLPVIPAEVMVTDSGRQHQGVIGEVAAAAPHNLADEVEGNDLLEEHLDVALPPEDRAERRRDVRGGQHSRRDLVEERLEHVMIASVEERDLHRGTAERFRGPQPRESPSDDHDSMDPSGVHPATSTDQSMSFSNAR